MSRNTAKKGRNEERLQNILEHYEISSDEWTQVDEVLHSKTFKFTCIKDTRYHVIKEVVVYRNLKQSLYNPKIGVCAVNFDNGSRMSNIEAYYNGRDISLKGDFYTENGSKSVHSKILHGGWRLLLKDILFSLCKELGVKDLPRR